MLDRTGVYLFHTHAFQTHFQLMFQIMEVFDVQSRKLFPQKLPVERECGMSIVFLSHSDYQVYNYLLFV